MKLILRHNGRPTYGGGWETLSSYECYIILGKDTSSKIYCYGQGNYRFTAIRKAVINGLGRLLNYVDRKIG